MNNDSDDEVPHLSLETFTALQEFYREQEERESVKEAISLSINEFNIQEDWQLSQFWYHEDTIEKLASLAVETVGEDGKIALISCPSIYKTIKNKLGKNGEVNLYEFDKRFSVFGQDFNFYDYKSPLGVPRDKSSYYDIVIADPPFYQTNV
ncbi:hypothetical protein HHI36_019128 [Cryptolaemus montrouzieri]|uniref:N(6)-adenine-specific DNA methyltransferase 2 n=1 Tax=Cryptolaemus montrouzieri TaxID=559131 RepID=A0ABD2P277_9CUCU